MLRVPAAAGKDFEFPTEISNGFIDMHRDLRKVCTFILHRFRRSNLRRFTTRCPFTTWRVVQKELDVEEALTMNLAGDVLCR